MLESYGTIDICYTPLYYLIIKAPEFVVSELTGLWIISFFSNNGKYLMSFIELISLVYNFIYFLKSQMILLHHTLSMYSRTKVSFRNTATFLLP